jgi:hypothetical protein
MRTWTTLLPAFAVAALLSTACTGEDTAGTGTLTLIASGGEGVREGFPHVEGTFTWRFLDEWTVTFDRFIVTLGEVEVRDPLDDRLMAQAAGPFTVDLAAAPDAQVELVRLAGVPAVRGDFGISLLRADPSAGTGNVRPEDLARLGAERPTMWISGSAVRGSEVVPFDLVFDRPAAFTRCANGLDNTRGVAVPRESEQTTLISFHVLHLFQDSLTIAEEGGLFFDALAAVAGDDGVVTRAGLQGQSITRPLDAAGEPLRFNGRPFAYDDGGLLAPADYNLWAYLELAARNTLHFNGLGLCAGRWR